MLLCEPHPFTDLAGHWSDEYVDKWWCVNEEIGFEDMTYKPNREATRGEYLKLMLLTSDIEVSASDETIFPDVPTGSEYEAYIETGYNLGIVEGFPDGLYRPDQTIIRVEALKIILGAAGITIDYSASTPFPDVIPGSWYEPYVATAYNLGIISGYLDGTFGPANIMLRGEMAKIVVNTYDL